MSCEENDKNILENISFNAKEGELTVIIGSVGSGKTSLLMTILGEMPIVSGKVKVKGRISTQVKSPGFLAELFDKIYFSEVILTNLS